MSDKCGSGPAKCTNKGCNPEKKPETCEGGAFGGFFGRLFGGGETSSDCGRCRDCGMEKCNCNCVLRDHLKQCCGYGTLPKLIDSCDAVNPPKKVDECAVNQDICGIVAKQDKCAPPPAAATSSKCTPASDPTAQKCEEKECQVSKCPPMPCTDTTCIPKWLCPPTSNGIKTYPAPAGVKINPISVGVRKGQGYPADRRCDTSGTSSVSGRAAPRVNPSCPMVKPRCGEAPASDGKPGIFARIMNWFGVGKKSG